MIRLAQLSGSKYLTSYDVRTFFLFPSAELRFCLALSDVVAPLTGRDPVRGAGRRPDPPGGPRGRPRGCYVPWSSFGSVDGVPMAMCGLDSLSCRGSQPRCGCASARNRSTICGWCSSNAGRSERTRGSDRRLCRGGGELVAHSSELPYPHGSSALVRSP